MAAYNDRRVHADRREFDRRWLGNWTHKRMEDSNKRSQDRRSGKNRREKNNPLSYILF